ncbi:ATP-binding protein [Patescibacteria group bacterium]
MYSVIIKNGTIIDGTKMPAIKADIAINNEKIAKIGNLQKKNAKLVIDASNLYITPGFIDLTTHSDNHWTIFSSPKQESFLRQGVTTIIGGHGGSSLAPFVKKESLETLEKWVDTSQLNLNWQTLKDFLEQLDKTEIGINFGTFVGHETLRRNVLKNRSKANNKKAQIIKLEFLKKGNGFDVKADKNKIHQVVSNLLDNAIKYTNEGFVKISLLREKEGFVLIKVEDSGVGISEEEVNKIFEKFTRASDVSKMHVDGAGLGLYVAKRIIEDHNGKIWAKSNGVGRGSTFFVELPINLE